MIYNKYGEYYDIIYSNRDYKGECEGIIKYLEKVSKRKVRSILDVGCGTSNHAVILASKGYNVVGIDSSEVMIN